MTFPLDEQHLAALRWAATALRDEPAKSARLLEAIHGFKDLVTKLIPENEAMLALSSPSASAQLVRDLLGACGCEADTDWADAYPEILIGFDDTEGISWDVLHSGDRGATPTPAIPPLILALLDALALPEEQRVDAALKALRKAGR